MVPIGPVATFSDTTGAFRVLRYNLFPAAETIFQLTPGTSIGQGILGVLPLAIAVGAGVEMRRSLGTAVFSGMLGVTFFGLLFTPTFYVVVRRLSKPTQNRPAAPPAETVGSASPRAPENVIEREGPDPARPREELDT